MQFIHLSDISYTYESQSEPVFSSITFDIAAGERIALIGDNGEGKSTILKIVMGQLTDFQGVITFPKKVPLIGYLPQDISLTSDLTVREELIAVKPDLYNLHKEIMLFSLKEDLTVEEGIKIAELWRVYEEKQAKDHVSQVDRFLRELKLDIYAHRSCSNISEGEKTRLQLGKLLLLKPDILLLDEPTNHLDLDNIKWLENWLVSFSGAVLFVSHDRAFIDQTATKIIELQRGTTTVMSGNYSTYIRNTEDEKAHQLLQYQEREKLLSRLQTASRKRRNWASSFQPETRAEGGAKKYESIFNEARTMHQQAKHIEQRMEMLQKRYPIDKPWTDKKRQICFSVPVSASSMLVTCSNLSKSFNDKLVFRNLFFHAEKGEKIWLSGKNGSGKSTLMRIIAGLDSSDYGEINWGERVRCGWFDQSLKNLPLNLTPFQYTKRYDHDESILRSYFGCLGLSGSIVNRRIRSLSWGERTKTQLVKLLVNDYNLLLLDEPTNHLDIRTRKMLEEALSAFAGTVIFVSHDRAFITHLATREYSLDDQSIQAQPVS